MSLTYLQLEQLFASQREALSRRLMRLVRSKELAADLIQETFVRLMGMSETQTVSNPRALLFRTASNLAIDHLRKQKVESRHISESVPLEAAEQVASQAPTPERELWGKQQLERVQAAIDALPASVRETFLLHRFHGYAYHEIAAIQGVSESTVDKRMNRALKDCWAALQSQNNS
ncbi:ECF subfamily RNA polymerase sigma-24 factor [Nitrospira japonica]|uniref:ECF subfamily RNA polymerase sigma-24 factor n=1 Tax=Nitrospira japonica TaxID=1325564 RepID=A0A1W1IAM3_9BACT|nr:RNA polymerase sigma factor [Nitrospira japonica]SLM50098.1 ECF subfamily RNA polymerase sigma-24 factor [Nitrospira japonica]